MNFFPAKKKQVKTNLFLEFFFNFEKSIEKKMDSMIFFPSQAFCYGDYYYDYYYQNTLSVCRMFCVSNRRFSNVLGRGVVMLNIYTYKSLC